MSLRFCFAQEVSLALVFFLFLVGNKFTLQVNNSGDKQHHSNESHHPTRQLFAFQVLHSLSCESQ